ncbi:hypothetical protein LOY46_12690 [Pseudomonas sichuanensis]|uniref:Beta-barrel porin 2 n=2 Tax=Pseudomonas TaxID=286 RepID=A0ABN5TLI5_9PSED|nr:MULTISPECIES: hypothetical protein [Pseudomonas]AZL73821.1 hypothetical protein EI693_12295 [Pseudomonas oryziphila]UVK85499.1 hypothetical protein LOY46_12690 [Pseudomonas sichuanensis]
MPIIRTTSVATVIMMMPFSGLVQAANWQSSVVVPTTVEYDSNPLLLTSDEKGVMRTLIEPTYNLVGTYGRDQVNLGLGVHVLRSSDTNVMGNREDPDVSLGWQRDTDKGRFGLKAQYVESSTLSGSVLDTGVVTTDGTQKMTLLTGTWTHALTDRTTLDNQTTYSHARYDITTLTGYDEYANATTLTYAWNARTDVFTGLLVRRYEPEQTDTARATNSYTPTVGVKYQLTDRLEGTVHAGVNQVSGSGGGRRGEGGVLLNYNGERADASFSAERSTVASAEGGFAELDMVRGLWSYAVSETNRVGLEASWQDSKGQTPNTLQTYSAWASHEFSPFWDLRLSMMYKERQQDKVPDAVATIIGLTLTYRLPDL